MKMDKRLQSSLNSGNGNVQGKTVILRFSDAADYDRPVAEALVMVHTLNIMTKVVCQKVFILPEDTTCSGILTENYLFDKAP